MMSNLIVGAFILVVFGHYFLPLCPKSNSLLPKTSYEQARINVILAFLTLFYPFFSVRDAHFIALFCPEFVTYISMMIAKLKLDTTQFISLGPW